MPRGPEPPHAASTAAYLARGRGFAVSRTRRAPDICQVHRTRLPSPHVSSPHLRSPAPLSHTRISRPSLPSQACRPPPRPWPAPARRPVRPRGRLAGTSARTQRDAAAAYVDRRGIRVSPRIRPGLGHAGPHQEEHRPHNAPARPSPEARA